MSSKRSKRAQKPDVEKKKVSRLNLQSLMMVSILLVASFTVILTVNPSLDLNFGSDENGIEDDNEDTNDPGSITANGVSSANAYGSIVSGPNGNYRLAYDIISGTNVQLMGWDSNYNEPSGAVTIPASFTYSGTTYKVTAIYGYSSSTAAFVGCTSITSVSIPNGVTSIGPYAFRDCSGLTGTLTIPATVTSIGSNAFSNCRGLTGTLTIPSSVKTIGDSAFYTCTGFTGTLTIPSSVTSIGNGAFRSCIGLTSLTIQNGTALSISAHAFTNCTSLVSASIPASVTAIGPYPFLGCTSLTSISMDSSNPYYSVDSYGAMYNKDKSIMYQYPAGNTRTSFTIPGTVITVYTATFYKSYNLKSVTIPNSVKTLGNEVFSNCTGLTSVVLPSSVTSGGTSLFYNCTSLISVNLGSMVTLDNNALSGCTNLTSVTMPSTMTSIGNQAFLSCTSLVTLTLPSKLATMGNNVFQYCSSLSSINLPNSVTSIGTNMFFGCSGLTSISVGSTNGYYSADNNGVLYNKAKTTLMAYPVGNSRTSFTIPSTVTTIDNNAFYGNANLTSITIPSSVTSIGIQAFYGSSVSISYFFEGNSLPTIGNSAFSRVQGYYSHGVKSASWWEGTGYTMSTSLRGAYYELTLTKASGESVFQGFTKVKVPSSSNNYQTASPITQKWTEQYVPAGSTLLYSTNSGSTWAPLVGSTLTSDTSGQGRTGFTLTYNINNGSGTTPSAVSNYGSIALNNGSGLTRANYYLAGWNTNAAGTGTHYNLGATYTLSANVTLYAEWKQYTITINSNSATSGSQASISGYGSTSLPSTSNLVRTGYYLNGWNTNAAGTGTHYNLGATYNITGNVTLYAEWKQYTITYNANSATTGSNFTQLGYGSTALNNGSGLARTGYYLNGWNTNTASTGTHYNLGAAYSLTGNVTLYAEWKQYTISYNANGATSGSNFTQLGSGSTALNNGSGLAKTGYYLSGWNTNSSGTGTHYNLGATYALGSNVTLYAEWSQYTITINANNATSGSQAAIKGYGSTTLPSTSSLARTGYYLSGWNTNAAGTGTHYNMGATYNLSGNVTLYAEWKQYTITYNANSATTGSNFTQLGAGSTVLNSGSALARTNYYLAGWNTSATGNGTHYDLGATYSNLSGNITLYAEWKQYTITYNNNTGTGFIASQNGVNLTLSSGSGFTKGGYTQTGWNTNAAGTGTAYSLNQAVTLSGNVTLYAVWKANAVTVTYNANGGSGSPVNASGVTDGAWVLPNASQYTRPGYTLAGWATSSGGSVVYTPGQSTKFVHTVTNVYAVWTAASMSVSFDGNGGSGSPTSVSGATGGTFTLPNGSQYTRPGYTLAGWSATQGGNATYEAGGTTTFKYGETKLFAVWKADNMNVIYHGNGGNGPAAASGATGGSYTVPTAAQYTKPGYTLKGWSKNDNGTVDYLPGSSQIFTYGINSLYAVWEGNQHKVTYYGNGGTGSPASVTDVTGGTWTLPTGAQYTRPGYTLKGWSTVINGNISYQPGQVTEFTYGVNSVYAVWEGNSIRVDFGANGGAAAPGAPTYASGIVGSTYAVPGAGDYLNSGYTLLGWDTSSSASTVVYNPGQTATFKDGETMLYAVWSGNSHKVTYHGGTGPSFASGAVGGSWTLPTAAQYTKPGYTLSGWSTVEGGSQVYAPGQTTTFELAVVDVYAIWSPVSVTVNYDGNQGTGSPTSSMGANGTTWTLPSGSDYTRPGYTLSGWSLTPNGGIEYLPGASAVFDYTITDVYAVWSPNSITVDYDAKGGSGPLTPSTGVTGGSWILPTADEYKRPGYTLAGWDISPAGDTIYYSPGQNTMFVHGVNTVYAVWSADSMTVTYHANGGEGAPGTSQGTTGSSWTLPSRTDYTKTGYRLVGWDTSPSADDPKYLQGSLSVFTYGITNVYAVWEIDPDVKYNIGIDCGTGGSATANDENPGGGSDVPLTITPQPGYLIDSITDNGSDVYGSLFNNNDGTWTYTIHTILGDHTVNVRFKIDTSATYTVSGIVSPNAGTGGQFDEGFTVILNGSTVKTGPGGTFTFSGIPAGFTGSIQVQKDGYIKASYYVSSVTSDLSGIVIGISIRSYTVTFNVDIGAEGTWPQVFTADHGYPISSMPPNPVMGTSVFMGWFVNGQEFDPAMPITENMNVVAYWYPIHTINVTIEGTGSGMVYVNIGFDWFEYTGSFTIIEGTLVQVRAAPESGHTFGGWTGGHTSSDLHIMLTPTGDVTLKASFAAPLETGDQETPEDPSILESWMFWIMLVLATLLIVALYLFFRERKG